MQKEFEELKYMLDAHYPLIYLASTEYGRIIQTVRSIAFRKGYDFHTWDIVDGLQSHIKEGSSSIKVKKHSNSKETKDPDSFVAYLRKGSIKEQPDRKEIFIMEDAHKYFHEPSFVVGLRKLSETFKAINKHLLILSPYHKLPLELEKYINVVNVPLPNRDDLEKRLDFITKHDKKKINGDLKKQILDAALGLTDAEADLAFRLARVKTGLDKKEAINAIVQEKEQIIKKSGILDYYNVRMDMDDVGGLDVLKKWLKQRSRSFERNAKRFGLKEPKGLLLLGVPGTGKSLTAKSIAHSWKQPLLKLDIGKVFQAEVGSSENNIRNAIATAEAVAPCVLWIDEIEKGLGTGGGERDGGTNSRVFSTILNWMQEKTKPVFVVATANNISNLPPELLRKGRFDEIFFVDLPTKKEREDIFRIHLKKYKQGSEMKNLKDLVSKTVHFSGAEIEQLVKDAMFAAYIEDSNNPAIRINHLVQAFEESNKPLAFQMSTKISKLREWAKTKAKLASSEGNEEAFSKKEEGKQVLTQREEAENIF